jgi:hypothetical protein
VISELFLYYENILGEEAETKMIDSRTMAQRRLGGIESASTNEEEKLKDIEISDYELFMKEVRNYATEFEDDTQFFKEEFWEASF